MEESDRPFIDLARDILAAAGFEERENHDTIFHYEDRTGRNIWAALARPLSADFVAEVADKRSEIRGGGF